MAKYLVEPVIGGGAIAATTIPLATAVASGTQYWDDVLKVMFVTDGTQWKQLVGVQLNTQQALPLIVPSSGTLSAAGALSAITALPATYTSCYMFFPANAVATVSAAGMYFVQMSSTTAGTVFQNTYTSGTPTIPSTLIPCTTASNYTQTTGSALAVYSATVPANAMGINGKLRFDCTVTNNNSAGTKTPVVAFGGTTVWTAAITTNLTLTLLKRVVNMGVASAQSTDGAVGNVGTGAAAAAAPIYLAIDTTTAQSFTVTMNLNTATDFVILLSSTLEIIPQS